MQRHSQFNGALTRGQLERCEAYRQQQHRDDDKNLHDRQQCDNHLLEARLGDDDHQGWTVLKIIAYAALTLVCITACGGGGGNTGTCFGSDLVCARLVPAISFVRVPEDRLPKITCTEISVLNNNDSAAYAAAAKDAYDRGRTDLDGDKDGIACNGVP